MPEYRRIWVPGGTYFFTVAIAERRRTWLTDHILELREAFRAAHRARPFRIPAMVVLPDHMHCLWTLPPGDTDYPTRWAHIKAGFSRRMKAGERSEIGWGELANPNFPGEHGSMRYRRTRQEGGTYFFTVNLADRSRRLLVEQVDLLRESVRRVKQRHPFDIVGWVVLPDHMHAIWTLPEGDGDCATRWMLIKAGFSRKIAPGERIRASRKDKGERGLWQRRFWEHLILDPDDLQRHLDYIHINPVKHGHVARASEWPYSSIHRYIRNGELPVNWSAPPGPDTPHGER